MCDTDDDEYWRQIEQSPSFIESLARARQQVESGKTISHAELKRALGIDSENDSSD